MNEIARLLRESQELLLGVNKVKYSPRRNVLFEIMTNSDFRIFPSVHLWEPNSAELREAVLYWEPGLQGESFYVAVHGHKHNTLCGGKDKWTQFCHMAYFEPSGVEQEPFKKKWKHLYADGGIGDSASNGGHQNSGQHDPRIWGVGLGDLGFGF